MSDCNNQQRIVRWCTYFDKFAQFGGRIRSAGGEGGGGGRSSNQYHCGNCIKLKVVNAVLCCVLGGNDLYIYI